MLMVISPAKSLDFTPAHPHVPATTAAMAADLAELAKVMRRLSRADLKRLMGISDKLALLNHERFQAFDPDSEDGVQAAMAFDGDVYDGLQARTLDKAGVPRPWSIAYSDSLSDLPMLRAAEAHKGQWAFV